MVSQQCLAVQKPPAAARGGAKGTGGGRQSKRMRFVLAFHKFNTFVCVCERIHESTQAEKTDMTQFRSRSQNYVNKSLTRFFFFLFAFFALCYRHDTLTEHIEK